MRWFEKFYGRYIPAHLRAGRWGEKQAEKLLKSKGFRILGRRVKVGKHDELDLIAQQGKTLILVEVKTRKNENYGRPVEAVGHQKQKKLSRAAVNYLKHLKARPDYVRFDVVEVIGEPGDGKPELRHIENAFPLNSAYRLWW